MKAASTALSTHREGTDGELTPRAWYGGTTAQCRKGIGARHLADLDFWKLAVAPQRGEICEASDELMRRYSRQAPGSDAATRFLWSLAEECRDKTRSLLLSESARADASIEFVSSMCRGLEIALARTARPATLVVSPFEHPAALAVVDWFARLTGARVCRIEFNGEDHLRPWQYQQAKFVDLLTQQLRSAGPTTLLLSAVCYATGLEIPAVAILDEITSTGMAPPALVLDCAHAAGNCAPIQHLSRCEAAVMSVHKWLLAPEPCGIVVTPRALTQEEVPYDSWHVTNPATTTNLRVFTSLVSSLRALDRVGPENFRAHSRMLRDLFLDRMSDRLLAIGELSGLPLTALLTVRPRPGRRWRFAAAELAAFLEQCAVFALVLEIEPEVPWLRVSFPYTVQPTQVERLCDVLEQALE